MQIFDAYEIKIKFSTEKGSLGFYVLPKTKITFMIKDQIKCLNSLKRLNIQCCITHDTWK